MKLSTKIILPIILISALLILLAGCFGVPTDESPGYTPGTGTITGIIAAPCCSTSADPVTETCCVSPEYWCYYCQQNWSLQDGIEVVLTYGEDVVATTTTNEDGEFTFTDVPPGKNYVVTAYCPDYDDNRPLVKDVALEVASTFDTKITDLVSTSLGLVVDFLVYYTEWGPEDISLDAVIADKPTFPNFPKFKALIYEVRRVVENCELNLLTDDDVLYATCRAAEEISGLDIGCGAGYGGDGGEEEEPVTYTLTMAVNPTEGGTTSPTVETHTYDEGTVVPIEAFAAACYDFDHWSGDVTGGTNPTTVTMNSDKTVTANFVQEEYILTVNTEGEGSVTKVPDKDKYDCGEDVVLTATAEPCWVFDHWEGEEIDGSTNNPETVTMDSDKIVTAVFIKLEDVYILTVNTEGEGSVTKVPDKDKYDCGEDVELTATAEPCWGFDHWGGEEIDG
ncbi:MAG TPA: hypothetical protein DCK79_08930, partial [Candidatus Atribacteria bacterium]|nr:hypothetical protein [Candidatus Atribacteria bacterium]